MMPRPGGPPAHQLADHPMERIHQFLKHAFMFPLAEVVEDGIVGPKVLGSIRHWQPVFNINMMAFMMSLRGYFRFSVADQEYFR